MLTITLKDGTILKDLKLNGNNYVSDVEIDTTIFTDDNLSKIVVEDENGKTEYTDLKFVQEVKYTDGYYFVFTEKTETDKLLSALKEQSQSIDDIVISLLGE